MNRTPTEAIQMLNSYVPQAMNNAVNNIKNTANNAFKITNNAFKNTNNVINTAINSAANNLGLPTVNNSSKSKIPWVYIIIGIIFITAVILLTVFYDKIMNALPSSIQNIFTSTPAEPVPVPVNEVEKLPEENSNIEQLGLSSNIGASVNNILPERKEVFNIAENRYTYNDAEPLCKAMGAELATYDQVKEAWKQGADWCNYGWVKGQRAVYPTQEETWEKLQSGPEDQRGACGIVGVNGGYFDNPDLRFGVNCYGSKPAQKEHDEQLIAAGKMQPATPDVIEFNRKVSHYKSNINEIGVLPFKQNSWNS